MTNLTARELMDTILRSLAETRAKFKISQSSPSDERTTLQPTESDARSRDEATHSGNR
jgi:hypothetical protein